MKWLLGTLRGSATGVDPVGELLTGRFAANKWDGWKTLLGEQYKHAQRLLATSNPLFFSEPSRWLSYVDSFNDVMFRRLQVQLNKYGLGGAVRTKNSNGELIDFGVLLNANNQFGRIYPVIADNLRLAHKRRNKLPQSHPYDKKTGSIANELTNQERNKIVGQLKQSYDSIIALLAPHQR